MKEQTKSGEKQNKILQLKHTDAFDREQSICTDFFNKQDEVTFELLKNVWMKKWLFNEPFHSSQSKARRNYMP